MEIDFQLFVFGLRDFNLVTQRLIFRLEFLDRSVVLGESIFRRRLPVDARDRIWTKGFEPSAKAADEQTNTLRLLMHKPTLYV